jgi:hypothetical protein
MLRIPHYPDNQLKDGGGNAEEGNDRIILKWIAVNYVVNSGTE